MKVLVIFEDTYGVFDIVASRLLGKVVDEDIIYLDNQYMLVNGICNIAALKFNKRIRDIIQEHRITDVVSIFDVDTLGGRGLIASSTEFTALTNKVSKDINTWYMPIVYNAETIELHQFLRNLDYGVDIIDLVNGKSIKDLHLNILQGILNEFYECCNAKVTRDFLDTRILVDNIASCIRSEDKHFRKWYLDGCPLDLQYFLKKEDVVRLLNNLGVFVKEKLSDCVRVYRAGDYIIDCRIEGTSKPAFYKIEE